MCSRAPPLAQKLHLAYHLTLEREELSTSLLDAQMARNELYLCAHLRAAWTDVGSVGVVRRPFLTKIDRFCQGLSHLRLDPVGYDNARWRAMGGRGAAVLYFDEIENSS